MSENKEFGLFLKEELTKKTNLNLSLLASILNCSRSTLNDLFKGKRSLSKAFAKRIETAFSSNSLSVDISIKADELLKKQAALIYKISGENLNMVKDEDKDADTQSSQDKDLIERSRDPSDEKLTLSNDTLESNNITTIQDQGIPFFAKFTKEKIESYVDNNQLECRGLIPELVYTLIATTASNEYLEKFYLPYGDDISLNGFDGIISYNQNHPYIPKGISVWEIGTNKDPKRKFDEDFSKAKEKLSKSYPSKDIHDVTYVAVFPRTINYENQEKWIRQKKKEGSEFKNIRIIDAFLLAQWANQSASAQLHFSKQFSNVTDNDILTNIQTSKLMYGEMSFNNIANGEELLDNLFSLYKNDYYGLFNSFIRDGLGSNILNAASESKILTKAFICYLAKVYDAEDKNNSTDDNVKGLEYQIKAHIQGPDDKDLQKDTDFDGYQKSRYTNLFLNTYYVKDYTLLAKLILALKVKSILIVDEEIIDDRIKELCRENKNVRIVAIRNSSPFDILDSKDRKPSLVEELGMEDLFDNSRKPAEEIELYPLPPFEIENTLSSFISRELKNGENKVRAISNNSQTDYLNLNKFSNEKRRTFSYLSEGSILNLKELLSNNDEISLSRQFIQQLKEQDINLNFLFCFCLMGRVNLDAKDKFDVTVLKELLKDVVTPDTDIEKELNKIVNLKLHKGIARYHNICYYTTARYLTLNNLYKNIPVNKKTITQNLYAVVISLLKIKTRNGFVALTFLDRNEFEDAVATSDLSSINEYNSHRGCKGLNGEFNGDFRENIDDRNKVSFLDYDNIGVDNEEKKLRKNIKATYRNLVDNILENFELQDYNQPLTAKALSNDLLISNEDTELLKNLLNVICFFTKTNGMNVELQIHKYNPYLFRELKLDLSTIVDSKQEHQLVPIEFSNHEKNSLYDNFFKSFLQLIGIAKYSEQLTVIDKHSYLKFFLNEIPYFIGKAKEKEIYNCFIEDHPLYYSSVLYSILYIAQTSCNSDFNQTDFKQSLELLIKLKDNEKVFCQHNVTTWLGNIFKELFNVRSFKNKQAVDLRCDVLKDNLKNYPETCKTLLQNGINNCIQETSSYTRPYSVWFSFAKRYAISRELFEYTVNSFVTVYLELVKNYLNTVIEKLKNNGALTQEEFQEDENLTDLNFQPSLKRKFRSESNDITANNEVVSSNADLYLDRDLDKALNRDDFRCIINSIPYLTKDSLDTVLALVKDYSKYISEDLKLEILELFEKKEASEQDKIEKIKCDKELSNELTIIQERLNSLSTFFNSIRNTLDIKSNYLKNKWLIESCNSRGFIFEEKVPLKLQKKYPDRDSLYKYLRKTRRNYICKILKKDGPRAIAWIIKNCKFILEYGENLISDLNLSVEERDKLTGYFVEEILINCDVLSSKKNLLNRLLEQRKIRSSESIDAEYYCSENNEILNQETHNKDCLQKSSSDFTDIAEDVRIKINTIQHYLDNCIYLLSYLSSIDDGFMLDRAYNDLLRKRKLSNDQRISVLLNLPFIEAVFNLVDKDKLIAKKYWSQIKIAIPTTIFQNKELISRLQSTFTKVDRLIDFTYSCYFNLRENSSDVFVKKLACDCTKEITKKLDKIYTEEFYKTDLNQSCLTEDKTKEENENFKESPYQTNQYNTIYNKMLEDFISHREYSISSYKRKCLFFMKGGIFDYINNYRTMFAEDLLSIAINSNMLSYEEKVILELYLLPYIFNNNERKSKIDQFTKEINYYFSVNPKEFFNFFCIDFKQNYYDKFTDNYFKRVEFKSCDKEDLKNSNGEKKNNNQLRLNCLYFTDKIFELIYPIPGFCYGQTPNYKDIEIWIEEIIQTAKSTHNDNVILSTEYKLAEILAKQNRGSNNLIPHIEICKAIENINDIEFNTIFECECFNSYSLNHITGCDDGKTNKVIADKFNALLKDKSEDEYPRTCKIIKRIRDTYFSRQ